MRVLLFPKEFPSAASPGAGIFVLRRAQALRDLGHDIAVVRIVPAAPPLGAKWQKYREIPSNEEIDGIPVHSIRAIFPPRMIAMEYLPLQVHRAVERAIERFRPDVLNASFLIPCGQIAVRQQVPTVVTAHGSDAYAWPNRRSGLMRAAREAIARAGRVTAVSGFIADRVRHIYDRPVEVIWNGGDERYFFPRDRAEARKNLSLPADRIVIAFAGNLVRAKGLYELIDAAAGLSDLKPLLVLAGTGPEQPALEEKAAQAAVDVRFAGRLDPQAVGQLFAAADAVTLPSYGEGMPNVVCEAMLNGSAVVASTVGGIPEIVQNGETGLLVPPRDAHALAGALRAVATNADLKTRIEASARAFACEHLTWRISARGYERVYLELLNAAA